MENTKNNSYMKLIPVMLCFFAMGFGGHCLQLRQSRFGTDGLTGKHLSVARFLLVPDLLCTYGDADEPHRA